jgi:hypothetical protein
MTKRVPTIGSLFEFDFESHPTRRSRSSVSTPSWLTARSARPRVSRNVTGLPRAPTFSARWARRSIVPLPICSSRAGISTSRFEYARKKRSPVPVQKELLTHTIDLTLSPGVKVLLNGKEVGEIKFQIKGALELEAGTLTIRDGKFTSLRPGKCRASAALTVAGKILLERKTSELVLPGEIRFGNGIPIAPGFSQVPVPHRVSET